MPVIIRRDEELIAVLAAHGAADPAAFLRPACKSKRKLATQKLLVVDCRPKINAMASQIRASI